MLHSFILFICFGDDIVMVVAIKKYTYFFTKCDAKVE